MLLIIIPMIVLVKLIKTNLSVIPIRNVASNVTAIPITKDSLIILGSICFLIQVNNIIIDNDINSAANK